MKGKKYNNREEFEKDFKVGDLITCENWANYEVPNVKIELISEKDFAFINEFGGLSVSSIYTEGWLKPNTQDLSDVFEFVTVNKYKKDISVTKWLGNQAYFESTKKSFENDSNEVLTIEEARERGFKF